MFQRIRWKLLATYLIVVFPTLIFLGVHLTRQFETAYADQLKADLLELARVIAANAAEGLSSGTPETVGRHLQGLRGAAEGPAVFVTDARGIIIAARGAPTPAVGGQADDPSVWAALDGRELAAVGQAPGRDEAVFAAVPVQIDGRVWGAVHVARPLTYLHAQIQHLRWVVAWATIVALLMASGLALLLARSIAGPVQEMQVVASHLAAGRLGERVPARTRDELPP